MLINDIIKENKSKRCNNCNNIINSKKVNNNASEFNTENPTELDYEYGIDDRNNNTDYYYQKSEETNPFNIDNKENENEFSYEEDIQFNAKNLKKKSQTIHNLEIHDVNSKGKINIYNNNYNVENRKNINKSNKFYPVTSNNKKSNNSINLKNKKNSKFDSEMDLNMNDNFNNFSNQTFNKNEIMSKAKNTYIKNYDYNVNSNENNSKIENKHQGNNFIDNINYLQNKLIYKHQNIDVILI